jgi:predicted outer membrane repeat protein
LAKFTERINESSSKGTYSAFIKPTHKRRVAALGTSGLVFGLSLTGNSIALATGDIDCPEQNIVTSVADPTTDTLAIQSKLTSAGDEETVCLSGNFVINDDIDFVGSKNVKGVGDSSISNPTGSVFMTDPGISTNIIAIENLTIKDTVGYGVFAHEIVVTDSSFQNNSQSAIAGYSVNVSNSTFIENENISGDEGGAIAGLFVTVSNSTFVDNSSQGDGGAIYSDATATVSNSTFTGNSSLYGGAIYSGTVDIVNSTFLDNLATGVGSEGGAIFAEEGLVFFSTFLNNEASAPDGGDVPGNAIYKYGAGEFEVGGNIFAGSSSSLDPQLGYGVSEVPGEPFTDLGGNLFTTARDTETDLEPKAPSSVFGASLASIFGSATPALQTFAPNSGGTQALGLVAGSTALNIVPNGAPFTSVTLDQRGATRTHPADAGAFEFVIANAVAPAAAAPSALAKTGAENPLWLSISSAAFIGLGALVFAYTSRLKRRKV